MRGKNNMFFGILVILIAGIVIFRKKITIDGKPLDEWFKDLVE